MEETKGDTHAVMRKDRITFDLFPALEKPQTYGDAVLYADCETERRKPHGDKFIVVDAHGTVVYEPK